MVFVSLLFVFGLFVEGGSSRALVGSLVHAAMGVTSGPLFLRICRVS